MKLNKYIVLKTHIIIAYLLVVLFTYAAVSKLLDFETFTVQLAQSPLLSAYARVVAWCVPGIELGLSVLLLTKRFRVPALYASYTLLIMFTAYIIIILNFSDFIPCSCGGVLEELSWTQHLIFNSVFIFLAGVAIFSTARGSLQQTLLIVAILSVMGSGTVILLFTFSEKKMHRNNAFQRRYIPHPIEKTGAYDLIYNSFYIAGIDSKNIYLGNITAPRKITLLNKKLKRKSSLMISLDQMSLPYSAVQIRVEPPNFFVGDGTIPILLKGKINTWQAYTIMKGERYFNAFEIIDDSHLALKSFDDETGENLLGILQIKDTIIFNSNSKLLDKQIDGIFDTEGTLINNSYLKRLVYTYFFRNQYIVFNYKSHLDYKASTIDTVSKAQLQIEENTKRNQKKLGANSILINKNTATDSTLLFIEAPRIGKYEPDDMLDEAVIIDVYNLLDKTYKFSFYLYHHNGKKLREFKVYDGKIYALQENYMVVYKLKKQFFK